MKQLFTIIVLMVIFGFSQRSNNTQEEYVELKWKLPPKDTLVYQTVMSEIDTSTFEMNWQDLLGGLSSSIPKEKQNFQKDFFDKLKAVYANTNLETKLSNSTDFDGVMDIEMIAKPNPVEQESEKGDKHKMLPSMMQGTVLRGSIHKTGELHSFWVKRTQKNLLSLFFELPHQPLKMGSTWSLTNVNLIGSDQNFICKEAEKKNLIRLKELKPIEGDTIALIEYDIMEYIAGNFNTPSFINKKSTPKKTVMKFVYQAQAEFSITKGKWIAYTGIMSLDASGALNSTQRQKFALIEK